MEVWRGAPLHGQLLEAYPPSVELEIGAVRLVIAGTLVDRRARFLTDVCQTKLGPFGPVVEGATQPRILFELVYEIDKAIAGFPKDATILEAGAYISRSIAAQAPDILSGGTPEWLEVKIRVDRQETFNNVGF